jgi:hypothetical protein
MQSLHFTLLIKASRKKMQQQQEHLKKSPFSALSFISRDKIVVDCLPFVLIDEAD